MTPQGLALILAIIAYLFAKPGVLAILSFMLSFISSVTACMCKQTHSCCLCAGVLQGAIDYYILDKFQRLINTKAYTKVSWSFRTETPTIRNPF